MKNRADPELRQRIVIGALLLLLYVLSYWLAGVDPPGYLHASGIRDLGHAIVPSLLPVIGENRSEFLLWAGTLPLELFFAGIFIAAVFRGVGTRLAVCLYAMYLLHWLCRLLTTLEAPDEIVRDFPDWVLTFGSPGKNDLWFSGHVANAFIIALASRGLDARISAIAWLYLAFQVWLVLATRVHYTIDIIGGLFVAYTFHVISLRVETSLLKSGTPKGVESPDKGGTS